MSDDLKSPKRISLLPDDGWSWMAGKSPHEENAIEYIRADLVDPAAIREAAWIEALDAAHQYTLMQYGMAFLKDPVDRARIIDMIGQRE